MREISILSYLTIEDIPLLAANSTSMDVGGLGYKEQKDAARMFRSLKYML